jgi:hypothetical protein
MSFNTSESFPFGDVSLSCVSSPELTGGLNVKRVTCSPPIPEGMSVDSVDAYVVTSTSPLAIHNFSFDLIFHNGESKGGRESGEHLDAQSWQIGDGLLMIGTEDGDVLQNRMPWISTDGNEYPIEYLSNGFRLSFSYIPPNARVEFHFVLAYNRIECENQSEWFAVDIPRIKLNEFPIVRQIVGANAG